MPFDHDTLVWFSKTFGLFYLIGLSVLATRLRLLAIEKEGIRQAANAIFTDEDKPWRN